MLHRVASAAMLVLFLFWMYFQWNDPDPALWMTIYGVAALCSLLSFMRRLPFVLPAVFSILCLLYAGYLLLELVLEGRLGTAFVRFVEDEGESAREMIGLLIAGGWTGYLALRLHRRREAAT